MSKKTVDVVVENHGTIFLFRLLTDAATKWVEEHVSEPNWFGPALAVEHRFASDLAAGMQTDGLKIK